MHTPFYTHRLFLSWFFLLVLIAVLHVLALEYFLYWTYKWFDIPMHFLGGIFVVLFALWSVFESGYVRMRRSVMHTVGVGTFAIIAVGLGWEVFEIFAGIPIEDNFVYDTTLDLIMDALGAGVGILWYITVYLRKEGDGQITDIHGTTEV